MRNAVLLVAVVGLLSGCGGSHRSTTTTPKKTHAQLVAAARAKAAAAAAARRVAKAAAKARAEGYSVEPGALAGYKFLNTKLSHHGCTEFGNHGCWRIEYITFKECPFFEMDINEMRRGALVEIYRDNQADVPPNKPVLGEFDATEDNVTLAKPVFTCNSSG